MSRSLVIFGFAQLASSLAFVAPQPTSADEDRARGLVGWSPKPTQDPLALFKRDVAGQRTCGWYEDDFGTSTITCPTGTCMAYAPSGSPGGVGCCASFNGGMNYQNCGWVNKCYDYSDILSGLCDEDCQANDFNRVCSVSSLPYCQSFTYPDANARDYGCDFSTGSTWITVSSDIADLIDGTATAQLAIVPAATTVTGWDGSETSSRSKSGASSSTDTSTSFPTDSLPSVNGSARTAGIAAIIVIIVIIVGMYCIGGCIVAWFCVRSKKNVAKWKSGSSVALISAGQPGAPPTPSNVLSPQGQFGGSYFHPAPQPGAAAGYYNGNEHKTPAFTTMQSPANLQSMPHSPAPPYAQPQASSQGFRQSQPYPPQQPYAQNFSRPQPGAAEMHANNTPRPNYAELG